MPPTPRRRRMLAASAISALAVLVPAVSEAAIYDVQLCHQDSSFVTSGTVASSVGNQSFSNASCGSDARNLGGSFGAGAEHANGDVGEVTFGAPSGTSLDGLLAHRVAAAGPARNQGAPVARLRTVPGGNRDSYAAVAGYSGSNSGTVYVDLDGASSVSWGVECVGAAGCPAGDTYYLMNNLTLAIRDVSVPSLANVAGTLLSAATRARLRSLSFAASDTGGGVYRQRLVIDGAPQPAQTVDPNGGACAKPFTRAVPCKTQASGSLSLDTAGLADGEHEVRLEVTDATDENRATYGPWSITVDNTPPGISAPTLTGTAREGDTLTCAATVGGQAPMTTSFQWLRTAVDGSGASLIDGATNPAYTMTSSDVGHKLVCRVTSSDSGGTSSRETTITQAPFDGGRSVAAYCVDRPTGPNDDCGDLDGDRIPNRDDDDVDGDGIPNVSDSAPYDPASPSGPTGGTGGPGAGGAPPASVGNAGSGAGSTASSPSGTSQTSNTQAAVSSANGQPSAFGAAGTVKFLLNQGSATFVGRRARWLKSAFSLRGRLVSLTGASVSGLPLQVSQTVRGKSVALGSTKAGEDGTWSFRVPRGPGRVITVTVGDGPNAASMSVRQQVQAHVTLRALSKRVRPGGLARFTGRLRGGHTNTREKLIEFQVYYRRTWRTIGNFRVSRSGKFSMRYRFGTGAYGRYKFRARTMPTDGYPFAVGTSSSKASTVRVG